MLSIFKKNEHFIKDINFSHNYPITIKEIEQRVNDRRNREKRKAQFSELTKNGKLSSNLTEFKNQYDEQLIKVVGEIPIDLPVKNEDRFLFISFDQSRYTHGIHKYPAKFFPELPRWIINKYSKRNDIILDPFSGSGTTNVEALLLERNSIGIDVDPFSRLLSKVKVTPIEPELLKDIFNIISKKVVKFSPSSIKTSDIPTFHYRDNWFQKEILEELTFLKNIINRIDTNKDIREFLLICFSSIIRKVSNADDNCTRTVVRKKLKKEIYKGMALSKFVESVLLNTFRMEEFYKEINNSKNYALFPLGNDARKIDYSSNYFDLAVTSPPYLNAVDYPRTHQLELLWLDLIDEPLKSLKAKHVGSEIVNVKQYQNLNSMGIREVDVVLEKIYSKDKRRSFIAYKFLIDMRKNLEEVHRVLKKDSYYVVVLGNNKIKGELFESWKYIMNIAEEIGFKIDLFFGSEIIRHFIKIPRQERINTDWVICFKK